MTADSVASRFLSESMILAVVNTQAKEVVNMMQGKFKDRISVDLLIPYRREFSVFPVSGVP